MQWDKKYEINVAFIDEQHREWFAYVAELGSAIERGESNEEMAKALKFVVEYTKKHFAAEEAFMKEVQYPGLESQRALHKSFEDYVIGVLVKLKIGKPVPHERFYNFMSDWIKKHIQEEDLKIGLAIEQTGGHAVPDAGPVEDAQDPLAVKLDELKELLAAKLITDDDFSAKKQGILQQFAADPSPATESTDTMAKLDRLKHFIDGGLLTEEDLTTARAQLAESVNLKKELALRKGIKAKMTYLKNLLDESFITTDQFEASKAEILEQI